MACLMPPSLCIGRGPPRRAIAPMHFTAAAASHTLSAAAVFHLADGLVLGSDGGEGAANTGRKLGGGLELGVPDHTELSHNLLIESLKGI